MAPRRACLLAAGWGVPLSAAAMAAAGASLRAAQTGAHTAVAPALVW
jgi:hypothetical protein